MYIRLLFLSILLFSSLLFSQEPEHSYYYKGNRIFLDIRGDQIAVQVPGGMTPRLESSIRNAIGSAYNRLEVWLGSGHHLIHLNDRLSGREIQQHIEELRSINGVKTATVVLQKGRVRHVLTDEFVVRFPDGVTNDMIEELNRQNDVTLIRTVAERTYLMKTGGTLTENGLVAANRYYESGFAEWAQPRFYYLNWELMHAGVNDPYWPEQWAHVNTGQSVASNAGEGFPQQINGFPDADMDVDLAWDLLINKGVASGGSSDILIAVLDSGVDIEHPDLADNLLNEGVDFSPDSGDNADDIQGHGTAVTGIIAATADNGAGVAGIAHGCKILPVKFYTLYGSADNVGIAEAIDYAWQNGADVLSNSWGGTTPDELIEDALYRAKTQGRDGRGCVIVFSSGNEGNGEVNYPAYLDYLIAVGASNMYDEKKNSGSSDLIRKWGGNYGSDLDLVAPTTVYTTDILGEDGFKEGDYSDSFGGTSASCPQVAAAAALVLSANANLTSDEVQNILQKSADPVERYSFNSEGWNKHVGYGRVNTWNAVRSVYGLDGEMPRIVHTPLQPTGSIDSLQVTAEITDNRGVAGDPALWYRTIFEGDTSEWYMITDPEGPAGNLYEFHIPGQKWRTQVHYYIAATDDSPENNTVTFPFGGDTQDLSGDLPPSLYHVYHVAEFEQQSYYSSDVPVSLPRSNTFYTSSLTIADTYEIVDLNATISVSGNIQDFAITLEAPDSTASGIAMLNGDVGEEYRYLDTQFDDESEIPITEGTTPYTGPHQPDNTLRVFDGRTVEGEWLLRVYDDIYYNNGGTIEGWSMETTSMLQNDAPVVEDIPAQSVLEGEVFTEIPLDEYVSDPNHTTEELTWSYAGNRDLIVTIDAENNALVTTPDEDWFGEEVITFIAMDPGGWTGEDTVRFHATNINDRPEVSQIPARSGLEDRPFDPLPLDSWVHDVDDADSLLNWIAEGMTHLEVIIDDQRTAHVEPLNDNWYGKDTVLFICTDPGGLSDSSLTEFIVEAVNDTPFVSEIEDQTVPEGASFSAVSLDDYVNDPDDPDSLISWSSAGATELIVEIDAEHVARVSAPGPDWYGQESIAFIASDTSGLSDSTSVIYTVTAVNDTPVVTQIPDQTIAEGDTFVSISLDNHVEDPDNTDETLAWSVSGNQMLGVVITDDRIAHIQVPGPEWNGSELLRFICSDPEGLRDSTESSFTVTAVNDTPQVSGIPDQEIMPGETFPPIELDDYVSDPDNTPEELEWTYEGNAELTVAISAERVATVSVPYPDWKGSERIAFIAADPGGLSGRDSALFSVRTEQNQNPVARNDTMTTSEDMGIVIDVLANDEDPDGDDLRILEAGPAGHGEVALIGDSLLQYDPDRDFFGEDSIPYVVSDNKGGTAQGSVFLLVEAQNDPPVAWKPDPVSFPEDDSLEISVSYFYPYVHDPDNPDSLLGYHLENWSVHLVIQETDSIFVISSQQDWSGIDSLIWFVSDHQFADTSRLEVHVRAVNDAPVIHDLPDSLYLHPDSTIILELSGYRYDVDTADSLLSWTFSVDDTTLKYLFTPEEESVSLYSTGPPGIRTLFLTLEDDSGAMALDSIPVLIQEPTSVTWDPHSGKPGHFALRQNYPNPFNPVTWIRYQIPVTADVEISLFDVRGAHVQTLFKGRQTPGFYRIEWNAAGLTSGLYLVRMTADRGFVSTRKVILLK